MVMVEKILEGVREEGLNYGLPMLFVRIGMGPGFQPEDLVKEILLITKCKWVCILGDNTTQVGMGTLAKGLSIVGLSTEVEVNGDVKDPGWLHTVDRWLVDYIEGGIFNFGALRTQDMIRFTVGGEGDLGFIKESLEVLKMFPGTKALKVKDKNLVPKALALAREYDRCRIYW